MPAKTNTKKRPKRSPVKRSSNKVETINRESEELILRLEAALRRLEDQVAETDQKTLAAKEKADSLLRKIRTA